MRYSYKKALGVLTEWANKEGFEDISLDYEGMSEIDWIDNSLNEPKHIKIEGNYSSEIKTYTMLHELGHHQLRKDWKAFYNILPAAAHAEKKFIMNNELKYKRRVSYTVACMEEEFKAWDEGFKLAEKLGIKINLKKWNSFKTKCLITYIRYYGTIHS